MSSVNDSTRQVIALRLSGRLFGIPVQDVKEVNSDVCIVPVPHAPAEIRGYMNIRGQILLVVDIRARYGLQEQPIDSKTRLIVFKNTVDEPFGILADQVDDILTLPPCGSDSDVYPLAGELMILIEARSILSGFEHIV